jgi:hypothetical protein
MFERGSNGMAEEIEMSEIRAFEYMRQWSHDQAFEPRYALLNADDDFKLRIDRRYCFVLPPDFLLDPKTYMRERGRRLEKSFTADYPNEAIYFVPLLDGNNIVVKRVEQNKAKDKLKAINKKPAEAEAAAKAMAIALVYKEFSVMYAAEKAGLPTAAAIGFLWSGAGDQREGYTLMNNVEGIPGRKLTSFIRNHFPGRKDEILTAVADQYEQVILRYRDMLYIDKTRWSIKDIIVQIDEATAAIREVIPIDWEWARDYDPRRKSLLTDRHDATVLKRI